MESVTVIGIASVCTLAAAALFCVKVYVRLSIGWCRSDNRLDGKTVIITGANSGIGKKTAEKLAARGGKVILACRNLRKANAAADSIREKHPGCNVVVKQLDLSRLESIRSFAAEINAEEERLDILINNAGVSGGKFRLTSDGYEEIYQANYLGPFLLTELLVPLLKKSAPARIINTGSSASMLGIVDVANFENVIRSSFSMNMSRYSDSKMAMTMWTYALAAELLEYKISVNIVHPGVVKTAIAAKQDGWTLSNLIFNFNIFVVGRTAEEGAQTLIHLSLDDQGQSITGRYWSECKPSYLPRLPSDRHKNQALLDVTREILEKDLHE